MQLFKRVDELQAFLTTERVNNRAVGFVPTMGALHDGHLSLVSASLAKNQITVASIFVNPTQFNDGDDLQKYPRTPGKDLILLAKVGCDVVFLPDPEDVYPPGLDTNLEVDLGGLDLPLEGAQRPGHFEGVAQVVKRLLDIVQPDRLYMGQKDYQQQLIIKRMVSELAISTKVIAVPTARENDGLAMSSRNVRLSADLRQRATLLHETLQTARQRLRAGEAAVDIEQWAMTALAQPGFRPEYFSLVNGHTLQSLPKGATLPDLVVACTAVWAGDVRLIDNLILKGQL